MENIFKLKVNFKKSSLFSPLGIKSINITFLDVHINSALLEESHLLNLNL